jgi:DNA-binding GntR family transcriptional regulator
MIDRKRYRQQCEEHLHILELLECGRNEDASQALRGHLEHTIENLQEIRPILER